MAKIEAVSLDDLEHDNRFGKNLAYFRRHAGVTQEQMAELTGMTQESLSRIEQGRNFPRFERIIQFAKVLGREQWDFFFPEMIRDRLYGKSGSETPSISAIPELEELLSHGAGRSSVDAALMALPEPRRTLAEHVIRYILILIGTSDPSLEMLEDLVSMQKAAVAARK